MQRATRLFQMMLLLCCCLFPWGCGNDEAETIPFDKTKTTPESAAKTDAAKPAPAATAKPKATPAKATPPESTFADPKVELQAALDDGIALLEQGNVAEFFERYLPLEELRTMRLQGTVQEAAEKMKTERPQAVQDLIKTFRALKQGSMKIVDDGQTLIDVEAELDLSDGIAGLPATLSLPDPREEKVPELAGFSQDLNETLAQAVAALEAGKHQEFVEKLFPRSELNAATNEEGIANLEVQLKEHPQLVERMLADLKALQKLTPEFNEQQTTATFRVAAENQPPRTVQFAKWRGNWRLADHSEEIRLKTFEQSQQRPIGSIQKLFVRWERIRDHWRLYDTGQ